MVHLLRKIFKPKSFQMDDAVTWDLNDVRAAVYAKKYGEGPFYISDIHPVEGCLCGRGPGECHSGQNCIPKNIFLGYDYVYILSDFDGKALKGRHLQPYEFSAKELKLV